MKIILIGYMTSGKSLIGSELAKILDMNFIDLDEYIEEKEGDSIKEIFSKKGNIFFRKIENTFLEEILGLKDNLVLSLGGGTPCFANNLELIQRTDEAKSIYLNVSVKELSKRLIVDRENRPLVAHIKTEEDMLEFVGKHLFERLSFYNQANYMVEANNSKEIILEDILFKLF